MDGEPGLVGDNGVASEKLTERLSSNGDTALRSPALAFMPASRTGPSATAAAADAGISPEGEDAATGAAVLDEGRMSMCAGGE